MTYKNINSYKSYLKKFFILDVFIIVEPPKSSMVCIHRLGRRINLLHCSIIRIATFLRKSDGNDRGHLAIIFFEENLRSVLLEEPVLIAVRVLT